MDPSQRRQLRRDFDRQSGSFELALGPVIFAALGFLLDRWLGVLPLFTLLLFAFGAVATVVKLWLGYDREMRKHEEVAPWARPK